jgi:hypothetical protein
MRCVVAARAGTGWSTIFIIRKALAVELEAFRLATVARLVLPFHTRAFRLLVLRLNWLLPTAVLGWLHVFLLVGVFDLLEDLFGEDSFVQC